MPKPPAGNVTNSVTQLRQRIACNGGGSRSFVDFLLDVLSPEPDDSALDLGPGLGAQLIPVAARVRRAVGVDVSPAMVAELRARLTHTNAIAIVGDMDGLAALDLGGPFSLVYAVYSLHYSRDPVRVVKAAAELLNGPRARFVCVTPDVGNNAEWFADLGTLYDLAADALDVPHICRRIILPACRDIFRTVVCKTYEDRIRFPSVEVLMAYYDACAPYCRPDRRDAALRHFRAKFQRAGGYEITKRSLAVVAMP